MLLFFLFRCRFLLLVFFSTDSFSLFLIATVLLFLFRLFVFSSFPFVPFSQSHSFSSFFFFSVFLPPPHLIAYLRSLFFSIPFFFCFFSSAFISSLILSHPLYSHFSTSPLFFTLFPLFFLFSNPPSISPLLFPRFAPSLSLYIVLSFSLSCFPTPLL